MGGNSTSSSSSVTVYRWQTASDTTGWQANNTSCPTCLNGFIKNLWPLPLLQCELEAAKNNATIFFADNFQNPGWSPSSSNFWRLRATATNGVTGVYGTYPEIAGTSASVQCWLFRNGSSYSSNNGGSYSTSAVDFNAPWATGTANGYTYRIYRVSVSSNQPYICALWLRANGLNVYGQGTQAMLSGLTATMTNGLGTWQALCIHGNCWGIYDFIPSRTVPSSDSALPYADGFCYGYTIYSN